ncbi:MAG: DUF2236 domain-containing protein [Burkholderiales bacterium]|nr:DUF2236 domain-containing protein [Burkholderiales bacterium]
MSAQPWAAMAREGDPLADETVAAIGVARLGEATRLIQQWTTNASLVDWAPADADPEVVADLRHYLDQAMQLPAWTRPADVARAEEVFMDYGPLSCVLLFCASLPQCYVMPQLSEVLHIAGQLEAHTEYRIRQTAAMVFPVMMRGGLTRPDGGGVAQVLKVRLIHASIRLLILTHPESAAAAHAHPANDLHQALLCYHWHPEVQGMPCSQLELAYTLLTFSYVFLHGMRQFGMPLSKEDEEAYLHTWNVVGHVLGIREELMVQTMDRAKADFDALQAMARERPADPDARPGLGRALVATMARSIELPVIRHIPVPMTRWLIGRRAANEIGVNQRVGLLTYAVFVTGRFAVRMVDAVVRLVVPGFSFTRLFTRVVGYHFLTRFLLDQTRPLGLPTELIGPMRQTVAQWHRDDRAPRWMKRLENRMTTQGEWRTAS